MNSTDTLITKLHEDLIFKEQEINTLKYKLEQKENIIKEVKETIKWAYEEDEYQGAIYTIEQILDKVGDEK